MIVIYQPDLDFAAEQVPEEYNVLDKRRIRQRYGLDAISVIVGSPEEALWIKFFTNNSRTGRKMKGLIRLTL